MSILTDVLFEISWHFQQKIHNLDEALQPALDLLIGSFGVDRAAVFLLDEKELLLHPRMIATVHGEIEGEGENLLSLRRKSAFSVVLNRQKELVKAHQPEYSVYFPLIFSKRKIGVLRVDNFFSHRAISPDLVEKLRRCAELFAVGIFNITNYQYYQNHVRKLTTLTRIGNAIATSLKLVEVLELALSSLVKDLGYDRAQVYLIDEGTNQIRENLSIDFRGQFKIVEDAAHVSLLIDSLLSDPKPSFMSRTFSAHLIAYIPISFKGKRVGLLIVDNLFTRQLLTEYDLTFLTILADQLSTVIENSRLFERVEKLSITDSLTGLFNHRFFYERLSEEILRANRFGNDLSLIMLDIDHFKLFNDTYGHQAGDSVLAAVAHVIQDNIRAIDVASRYGGEEMAIILPGTDIEGAKIIAERIRRNIREFDFRFNQQSAQITVSIGLVCYPVDATDKSELVRKADIALYWVKNHGRDGVCAYSRCEDL